VGAARRERLVLRRGHAREYYPFQIGVFASRQELADVKVTLAGLRRKGAARHRAASFSCINSARRFDCAPFTRSVAVSKGRFGLSGAACRCPTARAGDYAGTATITAGARRRTVPITIRVSSSSSRLTETTSRAVVAPALAQLTLAVDDQLVKPYTPRVSGRPSACSAGGHAERARLPEQIESACDRDDAPHDEREAADRPVSLVVQSGEAAATAWKGAASPLRSRLQALPRGGESEAGP